MILPNSILTPSQQYCFREVPLYQSCAFGGLRCKAIVYSSGFETGVGFGYACMGGVPGLQDMQRVREGVLIMNMVYMIYIGLGYYFSLGNGDIL